MGVLLVIDFFIAGWAAVGEFTVPVRFCVSEMPSPIQGGVQDYDIVKTADLIALIVKPKSVAGAEYEIISNGI
jgi:hypothetical protein